VGLRSSSIVMLLVVGKIHFSAILFLELPILIVNVEVRIDLFEVGLFGQLQ
jgi:hypothetical protein